CRRPPLPSPVLASRGYRTALMPPQRQDHRPRRGGRDAASAPFQDARPPVPPGGARPADASGPDGGGRRAGTMTSSPGLPPFPDPPEADIRTPGKGPGKDDGPELDGAARGPGGAGRPGPDAPQRPRRSRQRPRPLRSRHSATICSTSNGIMFSAGPDCGVLTVSTMVSLTSSMIRRASASVRAPTAAALASSASL